MQGMIGCDLHLGDSQLQSEHDPIRQEASCDLHLGDSQLQYLDIDCSWDPSCDLHLGDSQLQYFPLPFFVLLVVICI